MLPSILAIATSMDGAKKLPRISKFAMFAPERHGGGSWKTFFRLSRFGVVRKKTPIFNGDLFFLAELRVFMD